MPITLGLSLDWVAALWLRCVRVAGALHVDHVSIVMAHARDSINHFCIRID
ncbi:hypothetical protein AB0K00_42410 [Dactylosporangium sp. NPDC049525]|uniref:hypothetical protein n=1 Tax=Dactylosporangium sp. NPDC049525 TaxID=3154730 RepID=UPI003414E4A0